MAADLRRNYSHTFLDEMTLGDEEIDWAALSGSEDFVKELLEIGEDSLEFSAAEDELRNLQSKLNEAESRESQLKKELSAKNKTLSHLEDAMDQLKKELLEERARARDEAEDMAQEMAELRYQLTEILEEERQLRARTEQVSVHRVEELESQVRQAREEALAALARRREAECQAEKDLEELRKELEESRQQLEETKLQVVELNQRECEKCSMYVREVTSLKEELLQLTCKFEEKETEYERLQQTTQPGEAEATVKEICVLDDEFHGVVAPAEEKEKEIIVLHDEHERSAAKNTLAEDSVVEEPLPIIAEKAQEAELATGDSKQSNDPSDGFEGQINAFEKKLQDIQASEMQLQVERNDLCQEVTELKSLVEQVKTELQVSTERHTRDLLKHSEEKSLLQEEAASIRASLATEINRLQQAISERSHEHESTLQELVRYQTDLGKEVESVQQLATKITVLEAELQSERALRCESASKCMVLSQSLDEKMQNLSTMEAELGVSKDENETVRKALESAECQLLESTKEKHSLEEDLQQLRVLTQNQEQRISRLQQELLSQKTGNAQLAKKVGELNSEVLILQQQLITCQTQASEMAMKNVILEDMVATKRKKIKEGEEAIIQQAEKIGKQEEKYFSLQAKLCALQNDFSALEAKLSETRKREQDVRTQMERLSLELAMAKQEVVKSEVRLQKAVKQVKEQHEERINKHRQNEWFLNKKIEHLERSDSEKEQLQQELRRMRSSGV
ncbi:plectin-like [Selaginella moellendorffii]|uniref:plectin-like n=1 Tax=Selaginella moellendorffii TaxID=88036 RepID=UPI000D1C69E1|nr:plectin-like [Selaginella moellendorffii]|eukprot:XP_024519963.1 plectin-like [Selaginella moellendorffii]